MALLLGLILLGYAGAMVMSAALAPRMRIRTSLDQIDQYGYGSELLGANDEGAPASSPIAAIGARISHRLGRQTMDDQRKLLMGAGLYAVSPERFLGFRVLGTLGLPVLVVQGMSGSAQGPMLVLLVVLAAMTGWTLPQTIVSRRARLRLVEIDRAMPEFVDLLVVGVESGIGFNGAIRSAVLRIDGPLGEEMRLMLQQQSLGASLPDALTRMLQRCDTPATRSFVRTIAQGEKLGISIGQMMRGLAEEMRKRRKAQAEELAQKAPVKILFPLVFLIFPAIFIVLLTPAAINILRAFG
jgi:tight adherence protein C